jgi:hypothetical protein
MTKQSKWRAFAAFAATMAVVAGGALYAAHAQVGTPMYVTSVSVYRYDGLRFAASRVAVDVIVVDQAGQPVKGAKVTGTLSGCSMKDRTLSGTTDGGSAQLFGPKMRCGCTYTFTVTSVTKSGYDWNAPDPLPSDSEQLCD